MDYAVLENKSLEQRSFRLRPEVDGERVPVAAGLLVVVPGRDPETGALGVSDPVPMEMLKAEAEAEGADNWFSKMFETGVLSYRQVT